MNSEKKVNVAPELAAQWMKQIAKRHDIEAAHQEADELVALILDLNGYEETAHIFRLMKKWYS